MKTKIMLLLITMFIVTIQSNGQIKIMNTTGNLGVGDISSPDPYKLWLVNRDYNGGTTGSNDVTGAHIMRIFTNAGRVFTINSYTTNYTPSSQLITRIGTNYNVSGANSTTQYAEQGNKYAPAMEFNAENGSISLYGEMGPLGSDWRRAYLSLGVNVDYYGRVGIKTSANSSYSLYVSGNAYCSGQWLSSDVRLKKNITNLNKSNIKLLLQLNAASYQLIDPSKLETTASNDSANSSVKSMLEGDFESRVHFGYLAQDFEKIFPNLVKTDSNGYKALNYIELIPVIIEALKEQDSVISVQNAHIKELENSLQSSNLKSSTLVTDAETNTASLDQNSPNPFNQSTTIGYYVPEAVHSAVIYIYNMNGLQIKSFSIQSKGKGDIIIDGSELQPGMYFYTLIADGKEIDTKRMILTQ